MTHTVNQPDQPRPSPSGLWQKIIDSWVQRITAGKITVELPGDQKIIAQGREPGPDVTIKMNNGRPVRRMLTAGDKGFFESYMDGDWSTDNLTGLLELAILNEKAFENVLVASWPAKLLSRLWHRSRANTRRGSRKNISYHYDMGNEFYGKWLDPTMTYSSAVFRPGDNSLETAQLRKYHTIAERLDLKSGEEVLEIGCGWGGFATVAARDYGCDVTCITLSKEQKKFAEAAVARAGLSDRVEFRLEDYRDTRGKFDKIVSIEMFEAVGEEHWQTYFNVVRDRLKDQGQALLQIIFIHDRYFDRYRRGCDFIQRHIFPGGMLPSAGALKPIISAAGLDLRDENFFGKSYAETLRHWRHRFENAWDEIRPLGFDDRFYRLWTYYLSYCEAGFDTATCNVGHYLIARR